MRQTLINIITNILPYYFTKFEWCRYLIYQSTNKYNPINLSVLDKDLQDSKDFVIIDLYGYYEETYLQNEYL